MPLSSGRATRLTFATGCRRGRRGVPDEGVGGGEIRPRRRGGRQALQRGGDALEQRRATGFETVLQAALSAARRAARYHARRVRQRAGRRRVRGVLQ